LKAKSSRKLQKSWVSHIIRVVDKKIVAAAKQALPSQAIKRDLENVALFNVS
jgi:hypothetical protein